MICFFFFFFQKLVSTLNVIYPVGWPEIRSHIIWRNCWANHFSFEVAFFWILAVEYLSAIKNGKTINLFGMWRIWWRSIWCSHLSVCLLELEVAAGRTKNLPFEVDWYWWSFILPFGAQNLRLVVGVCKSRSMTVRLPFYTTRVFILFSLRIK